MASWFNPFGNGVDEEYLRVVKKIEEENKNSPRIYQVAPTTFKSTSGTRTNSGTARTYQWERDMLKDLPNTYGRSLDDRFSSMMNELGVSSKTEQDSFRKYLDATEKGVSSDAIRKSIVREIGFDNDFNWSGEKETSQKKSLTPRERREQEEFDKLKPERSILDRAFDFLLMGNYASAGFVDGARKAISGEGSAMQAWKQAGEGIRASNPFGDGYEKGEYTFAKVLENSGWKPESMGGRIARASVGTVGDVLLDPTTYLTLGGNQVIKGTGKVGKEVLSLDKAKDVIKRHASERGYALADDAVEGEAQKLVNKFNSVRGIYQGGDGVSLSLGNMPFGEKIFGQAGKARSTIVSGDTMRNVGDKLGVSRVYSKTREIVYGSRIGKLLSEKGMLQELAKKDPAMLYDVVKFADFTRGLNADKLAKEANIAEYVKGLNLSPAENKQLLDTLQNPATFRQIRKQVRLAETQEAKRYKQLMKGGQKQILDEIQNIHEQKNMIEQFRMANAEGKGALDNELKQIEDEYIEKMVNVKADKIFDLENIKSLNQNLGEELQRLTSEYDAVASQRINLEPFQALSKQWDDEFSNNKKYQELRDAGEDVSGMETTMKSKFALVDEINKTLFPNGNGISTQTSTKDLKNIIKMIEKGESPSNIRFEIERKPALFNGTMKEAQSHIASVLGYGQGTKHKNIEEFARKPLQELVEKQIKGETLSQKELQEMATYQQRMLQYHAMTGKLYSMSPDALKKYLRDYENKKLESEIDEILPKLNPSERPQFNEYRRDVFNDSLRAKEGREYDEFNDPTSIPNLTNAEVEQMYQDIFTDTRLGNSPKWAHLMVKESEKLLKDRFKMSYTDMSGKQKDMLFKIAGQNVSRSMNGKAVNRKSANESKQIMKEIQKRGELARIGALGDQIKYDSEIIWKSGDKHYRGHVQEWEATDEVVGGKKMVVKDWEGNIHQVEPSQLTKVKNGGREVTDEDLLQNKAIDDYTTRIADLKKQLADTRAQYKQTKQTHDSNISDLEKQFEARFADVNGKLKGFEEARRALDQQLADLPDDAHLEDLYKKYTDYEQAFQNDDALETFMYTHIPDKSQQILKNAGNGKLLGIELDNMPVSDKVKNLTKELRMMFNEIAESEIRAGKLKREQFDAMKSRYLAHIATSDGRRLFKRYNITTDEMGRVTKIPKALEQRGVSVTQDFGYGQKFNEHSISRTITKIQDANGNWIENPTIEQINENLSPLLRGKNAFSEEVADIYMARALKNAEVLYDDQYMRTMMNTFGKDITDGKVEKGYKAVANIGLIQEAIQKETRMLVKEREKLGFPISPEKAQQEILNAYGLTKNAIEKEATPMVELTPDQVAKFQKRNPTLMRQVNEAIVNKANQSRKIQIAKDHNALLRAYDKFQHWIKLNQTTIMPAFHARNWMGNTFNNYLALGADAVDPKMQIAVAKVTYHKGDRKKILEAGFPNGYGVVKTPNGIMEWDEVYRLAKVHDVIDEGFFAKDIGAETGTKGLVGGKLDPTDTENFLPYQVGGRVGNQIENQGRLLHFASQLKRGMTPEQASESVNKYLFDYSDLTAFEQNVMKRLMPYYTWIRKNGRLQVGEVFDNPARMRNVAKGENFVNGMVNEEERVDSRFMSDFAQNWLQTGASYNTENALGMETEEPILYNPNLPYMDLARIPDPTRPVDSAINLFTQGSPIFKVPIEQALNKNFFFDNVIAKEDDSMKQQAIDRMMHVLGQNAGVTAGVGAVQKDGLDKGLHIANALTGQKFLSYDYETARNMKIAEILGDYERDESVADPVIRDARELEERLKMLPKELLAQLLGE